MSTLCRTPFVGVGTGRCGTNSLTEIVDACKNASVTHERYQLNWYEVNENLGKMLSEFRAIAKDGVLAGDVSQANAPHVGELRSSFPALKVVCLHRDKTSTRRVVHQLRVAHDPPRRQEGVG